MFPSRSFFRLATPVSLALLLISSAAPLAASDFHKDILPIFEKRCASCHSEKDGKKPKGGYVFDAVADIKSNVGPSFLIRPNDAGNSDLMAMVTRANKDHPMPPDAKDALPPGEIKKLREWIEAGADIPDKDGKDKDSKSSTTSRPSPTASSKPTAVAVAEDWTSSDGKTIKATLVKCAEGKVVLRMAGGKEYTLPLSKLNTESQERAMKTVKKP